ncbi:hypothetical protein [Cedecea neteri]|uniref:hypothetical protein n=1 Tax=Cedecea neteri TaxID=158822 RepID=UPI000A691B80|nr:hypothetical protein [Cedecea neteri]
MAKSRKDFQSILNYRQTDGTIDYAIVSGVITATSTTGDKDSVVNKVYTFTPLDVISELRTINALQPLYEGSFGVGSNGVDVPQYEPVTPDGNSFIKVPADQTDNPVGADMLGIGLVDMSSVCKLAISKAGNLNIYAMNTSTAWTRILTATQIANQYVPLSRTVNGKALTSDIVLNNTDVGLGNVTNEKQLVASKNLSDVTSVITARKNLDVYSTGEVDSKLTDINNNLSGNYATKQNLSDAVQPLATKTELSDAVAPLATKTELSDTAATLVPKTTTVNGKALSGNVVINSADVGLGNVTNEKQLVVYKNLSDLGDVNAARTNLGLGTMALQNSNAVNITGGQAVLNYISSTSGGFNSTASNPLSIASVSPTIKFTEAGVKDWFLVANGGSIRLQPDSTGSPDIAFSFNPATKLMSLMNVNASSLTLGTALGILSGGTGANNVASARTNLQVDRLIQNNSFTLLTSPDNTRLVIGNGGDIGFQNSNGNPIGLPITGGGTGSINAVGARTNLGLGSNNTPTFAGADLTTSGVANSGILTLNIANTSGATTSSGRLYHEVQNGVGKMTFHVSANGKNAYMQLDEDGKLIVPGTLSASGGITANSSIIAAQGQVVGLTTTSGGNKNIFLSNAPGDGSSGGWVNF